MSEYLCFKVELDARPVAVIVSDDTLRVSFSLDDPPNDLNHLYIRHRSAIHDAAVRRAAGSTHRPVVLRVGDLSEQCVAGADDQRRAAGPHFVLPAPPNHAQGAGTIARQATVIQ